MVHLTPDVAIEQLLFALAGLGLTCGPLAFAFPYRVAGFVRRLPSSAFYPYSGPDIGNTSKQEPDTVTVYEASQVRTSGFAFAVFGAIALVVLVAGEPHDPSENKPGI